MADAAAAVVLCCAATMNPPHSQGLWMWAKYGDTEDWTTVDPPPPSSVDKPTLHPLRTWDEVADVLMYDYAVAVEQMKGGEITGPVTWWCIDWAEAVLLYG